MINGLVSQPFGCDTYQATTAGSCGVIKAEAVLVVVIGE